MLFFSGQNLDKIGAQANLRRGREEKCSMETENSIFTAVVEPIPLEEDADGVVRVGKTRVTLDTLVACFMEGTTAEEIAQQYPTLNLADIYSVLGYYLRRREQVDDYLERRRQQAKATRQQNEQRSDPSGVRARLLARQTAKRTTP